MNAGFSPCQNESAMRRNGGRTLRSSGHATGDHTSTCWDSDFKQTAVYVYIYI